MDNQTIISLWKKEFSTNNKSTFLWDNILWIQTKKDFTIKAYLISDYIKKIPWDKIWIMVPSVWSASLLLVATYLSGKIPVMYNWTLWKESFDHCINFSWVDKILTSSNFYEKVKNDFLDDYKNNNKFLYIEDLLKNIKLSEKLVALVRSIFLPVYFKQKPDDVAVILFTSWSESLPKAVPLTHENLIENIKWTLTLFNINQNDRLLWFLPPFHSFWFTINTILPLITWMQVVYTPDPNDAKTILEIIKHTKVTTITSTPTFLKMIMSLASVWDFDSIKYVAVWAEKCSDEVFKKFEELCPNWKILEWYGITECSPVVSINPIDNQKRWSVWKVIPCLDCKIIDIESNDEKNIWEQWMIYVSWKSIFKWYLDEKLESPFEEIDWKSYYKTWDLWILDSDWYLIITWRLKRFVKIAWEMISLPFVETILLEKYWNHDEVKIAVEAIELYWEAKLYLFSIEHIEIDEVNDYLRKRWVSNLVKITDVIIIKEIPILGTWKIDYKYLKSLISEKIKGIIEK